MSGDNPGCAGTTGNNMACNQKLGSNVLNINSPEFIPQIVPHVLNTNNSHPIPTFNLNNANTTESMKMEIEMMTDTLKKINIEDNKSMCCAENLALELESRLSSSAAFDQLAEALLDKVYHEPDCVSAAVNLATCLSQKITAANRPELLYEDHSIGHFPFFCALFKALDGRLAELKIRVSSSILPSKSDSALLYFLSGLYLHCGSPADPQSRFALLATCLLQQLKVFLMLYGNKDAHDTVVQVLLSCYRILDQDTVPTSSSSNVNNSETVQCIDRQLLEDIYERLRHAVAYSRCGSAETALQVIHLLEVRATNCGLSASYFSTQPSNHDDLSMTDEMFDDYEAFLLLSGQVTRCDDLQNGF